MKTYFTGKELKEQTKNKAFRDICIRIRQRSVTIEFQETNGGAYILTYTTEFDNQRPYNLGSDCKNDWVLMYSNQADTQWQFFVNALKPTDEIQFFEQENGNQYTKEAGLAVLQLMARVTSRKRDQTLSAIRQTAIDTRINKLENL